jgi:hypothetical protein
LPPSERLVQLGQPFDLDAVGSTFTGLVCGLGVRPSVSLHGELSVANTTSGQASFEVSTTGSLTGGASQLLTAGGCDKRVSTVRATVSFETNVRVIVRSEAASAMRVRNSGAYEVAAEVKDWEGKTSPRSPSAATAGEVVFTLPGAGIYSVHVSGKRQLSAQGDVTTQANDREDFSIVVGNQATVSPVARAEPSSEEKQPAPAPGEPPLECGPATVFMNFHRPGNSGEEVDDPTLRSVSATNYRGPSLTFGEASLSDGGASGISIVENHCSGQSAKLNSKIYEKGQAVTDEEMDLLNIRAHRTLPEWNYTIKPYVQKQLRKM